MAKGTRLGKRRKIVAVLHVAETIMSKAKVRFECGHEGYTWQGRSAPEVGAYGHCRKCLGPEEGGGK